MHKEIRPVGIGLILGMAALMFGIVWMMFLTKNGDAIRESFELNSRSVIEQRFVLNSASTAGHEGHAAHGNAGHSDHGSHDMSTHEMGAHEGHSMEPAAIAPEATTPQEDPVVEKAFERLKIGHVHAMGLGLLAIVISLALGFTGASGRIKSIASACVGVGSVFFPLSCVIAGFRMPSLGVEAAQKSVLPIAAFSIILISIGVLSCLYFIVTGVFRKGR